MRAALADDGARLEEQVHQHGLAAADLAINVKALDRLARALLALAEQPAERRRFAREPVLREPQFKRANCRASMAWPGSASIFPAATSAA